jgi:hypothetical protein
MTVPSFSLPAHLLELQLFVDLERRNLHCGDVTGKV